MTKKNELDLTPLGLRLILAAGASAIAMGTAGAWAQDAQEDDDVELIEEDDEVEASDDTIVVTGSRIKRSTFNSISPLQVISAEESLDVGLVDPASILQQSEAAAGQQIDATFQGFVLDNGPGSQTLNLRGLGADRTLLLINGRRMAPGGVEGAPSNPSINFLPGSLVERYDLLLDGASSVYGSDAVAGVGNVVLKKDFDGLELFASGDYNQQGEGHDYTLSAAYGKNNDRGFFGVGVEYDFRDEVTLGGRDFLAGCETNYEVTSEGEIRTVGIADALVFEDRTDGAITTSRNPCVISGIVGRVFSPFQTYGSIYYTPGFSNSGIPNYSETALGGIPIDGDGDGIQDVDLQNRDTNGANLDTSFISEQKRFNAMAYGEYTFEGEMNLTPFFEVLYTDIQVEADNGQFQLFPAVPGSNPFNFCNISTDEDGNRINPNGVDCAAAEVTLLGRPGGNSGFSLPVLPIVSVTGDRENVATDIQYSRFVGGVRGDLPFLNVGSLSDFTFEASALYTKSDGGSERFGIREDRLAASLGVDPTVDTNGNGIADDYEAQNYFPTLLEGGACDFSNVANPELLSAEVSEGCVPVNLFADSLLRNAVGDFETQAERDYLFGVRSFDTVYEQTVLSAFVTGQVAELPAGPISVVLGGEYRNDKIDSQPNDVAANGLFFGFSADQGAQGEKWIREAFGEIDIPLLGGKPLAREWTLNASARFSEEEFYGSAWTYSVKTGYRPFDPLLLKASFGTSFRAPNLRENFLAGQTGFDNGLFDPCAVPGDAFNEVTGEYDPQRETRDDVVLQNCRREGRDPTRVGIDPTVDNTQTTTSAEVSTGGSLDLEAETSESFTAGLAFEQPWFDSFDLSLNVNYYDIEIEGAVVAPSAQFIVNDCYARQDGTRSAFCDRIQFDNPNDASTPRGLINFVTAGFINQDTETVTGLDYNLRFAKEFDAFDEPMTFRMDLRANQLKERTNIFVGDSGNVLVDEDAGEFGFPEWTGTGTFSLDVSDYRFTWQTRYIGDVEQQEDGIDPLSDAFNSLGNGFIGDTCGGPTVGDVLCRDVGYADEWAEHSASIRYSGDTIVVRAGVTNVFDNAPPRVDGNEVFSISNTPIGNGYDLDGREYFVSVSKEF